MTTEMAMNPGVGEWLLLDLVIRGTRTYHGREDGPVFQTDGYGGERPGWDDKITEAFLHLEENGHVVAQKELGATRDMIIYTATDMGRAVHQHTSLEWLRDSIGAAPSGRVPSPGDRAMWLWLLRHGGVMESYSTSPSTTNNNMLHMKVCGVNYDLSGSVQDDSWSVWGGSFAENGRAKGVGGEGVCRCGLVGAAERDFRRRGEVRPEGGGRLEIVAEVDSIVSLLKAMVTS